MNFAKILVDRPDDYPPAEALIDGRSHHGTSPGGRASASAAFPLTSADACEKQRTKMNFFFPKMKKMIFNVSGGGGRPFVLRGGEPIDDRGPGSRDLTAGPIGDALRSD
jgi:hypothetical protein